MSLLFLFAFWMVFLTTRMDSRKVVASWGHIWLTHPHCGKKSPRKYTVWRITSLGLEAWDETKPETFWRNWQFKCRWNQSEEENKFLTHRIFLTSKTRPCKMEGRAPVHCFESSQEEVKEWRLMRSWNL